jgi:enoyl-CoA hydratase/carnithine racemase
MSAQRAHQIGFVTEVVPLAELRESAEWLGHTIASAPPVAVQGTVRSLWAARELSRAQALEIGKVIIRLGSDPSSLYAGQQAFAAGDRARPRIR